MEKDKCRITSKMFWHLGIDPKEAVKHVETKKASEIDPQHVTGLLILRSEEQVASA